MGELGLEMHGGLLVNVHRILKLERVRNGEEDRKEEVLVVTGNTGLGLIVLMGT